MMAHKASYDSIKWTVTIIVTLNLGAWKNDQIARVIENMMGLTTWCIPNQDANLRIQLQLDFGLWYSNSIHTIYKPRNITFWGPILILCTYLCIYIYIFIHVPMPNSITPLPLLYYYFYYYYCSYDVTILNEQSRRNTTEYRILYIQFA